MALTDAERAAYVKADTSMTCWTCILPDGRIVELMDFEVEVEVVA